MDLNFLGLNFFELPESTTLYVKVNAHPMISHACPSSFSLLKGMTVHPHYPAPQPQCFPPPVHLSYTLPTHNPPYTTAHTVSTPLDSFSRKRLTLGCPAQRMYLQYDSQSFHLSGAVGPHFYAIPSLAQKCLV